MGGDSESVKPLVELGVEDVAALFEHHHVRLEVTEKVRKEGYDGNDLKCVESEADLVESFDDLLSKLKARRLFRLLEEWKVKGVPMKELGLVPLKEAPVSPLSVPADSPRPNSCPNKALGIDRYRHAREPSRRTSAVAFNLGSEEAAPVKKAKVTKAPVVVVEEQYSSEESDDESIAEIVQLEKWSDLKRFGWSAQQGTGLHTWLYCRPGARSHRDPLAREGQDFFTNEEEALNFARRWRVGSKERQGHVDEVPCLPNDCGSAQKEELRSRQTTRRYVDEEPELKKAKTTNKKTKCVPKVTATAKKRKPETSKPRIWETPFEELWPRLVRRGWSQRHIKGGEAYVRPGTLKLRTHEHAPGLTHFASESDLLCFLKSNNVDLKERSGHMDDDEEDPRDSLVEQKKKKKQKKGSGLPIYEMSDLVIWSELRTHCGWEYRSGSKLQDWIYLRPGGTVMAKGGAEGRDYFFTEKEAVAFAKKHAIDGVKRHGHVDEDLLNNPIC